MDDCQECRRLDAVIEGLRERLRAREPVAIVEGEVGQPQSYGVPVFISDGVTRTSPMVHVPAWPGAHVGQRVRVTVHAIEPAKGGRP